MTISKQIHNPSVSPRRMCAWLVTLATCFIAGTANADSKDTFDPTSFNSDVQPLLKRLCHRCHNADNMESGIRVDVLNGDLEDRHLRLWEEIQSLLVDEAMPPEDETQPTPAERQQLVEWIELALNTARARQTERNGSVRRLTVSQYRNTLRELLGVQEDLVSILPLDAVSKDGFTNNSQSMLLSPLQVEAYFSIAERALDLCIVDEDTKPTIQKFRVDLGKDVNPAPYPEKLILGANNHLLENGDFVVSEPLPDKPFDFTPFVMRTKYRFNEGYQGNSTVRGWREYDSIYHSVFACMRGNPGYPKGRAYEAIQDGLLLRPAIPSAELFQVESTYGPKANFKISLRELPNHGNFRVTVTAAKYDDGLLLDQSVYPQTYKLDQTIVVDDPEASQPVNIQRAGIYQVDAFLKEAESERTPPDASRLDDLLVNAWTFDDDSLAEVDADLSRPSLHGSAKLVESPFGKSLSVDGAMGYFAEPRNESMNVGEGDFTVAAWIRPTELRQAGIVCLGRYSYAQGWYFDMPNNKGVLRIETMNANNELNGKVQSRPGVIRRSRWQHVAAVVRRGDNSTRLYVNGYEVARGTINTANLDSPSVALHIGRIQDANLFKGDIDDVRIYRRPLDVAEIEALVEPGRKFAKAPPAEPPKELELQLGDRHFSGQLKQSAFLAVRLPSGPIKLHANYGGATKLSNVVLTPLDESDGTAKKFSRFENRTPRVGVHVGLRRDCGSTMNRVESPQEVTSSEAETFVFEGAINNFPSPDVEEGNDNYLAGIREIGVRSEYTDGRDMPRLLIKSVEFEGPFYEEWPPVSHRRIFIDSPHKDDPSKYARDILRSFASRAFRRPVTMEEETALLAVWSDAYEASGDFQRSIKDALLVVLTSPQFLFLVEDSATPKPESLTDHELASKLSYFLWNAPPDDRLLELAINKTLHDSLDGEIERLVHDERFAQFASEFVSQWLSLDKFDVVQSDRKRFPNLTRDAKEHLRNEPIQFVQYLIRENLPVRNLVESPIVMANEVVANYYGLGERTESGFSFAPIQHDEASLGGVLTQASILAGLSDGREANPIKRGAWLARKIVAEPPDDPPPNVPGLEEEENSDLTLREKLERHRNQKGCVKCHTGIDPWGVPFEEFDAGGLFSSVDPNETISTLPDETKVANVKELKEYLANDRIDQVAFSFLKHVASYAIGRSLSYNEVEFLREEGIKLGADGYLMKDMIRFVVNSDLFLKK